MFQIVQIDRQLFKAHRLIYGLDLGIAEPALRLSFKLRIFNARIDHRRHALAEIVAGKIRFLFLDHADSARVIVKRLRDCRFERDFVRAALGRGHVVDERIDVLRIRIGILNRDAHEQSIAHGLEHDRLGDRRLVGIQILHEIGNAAVVAVFKYALVRIARALVGEYEFHALVQIRELAHAAAHDVGLNMRVLEHARVRLEADLRAALPGVSDLRKRGHGMAGDDLARLRVGNRFKALLIVRVILIHVHDQPFGKRVHDRRAHAVQAAGIRVVFVVEFAARVQLRINDLDGRNAQLRVNVRGNAAAVVGHLAGAVPFQRHRNFGRIAVRGLVDRIVDDFPDHVVQSAAAGGTNIHARAHAHRVQPLQNLYINGGIRLCHITLHYKAFISLYRTNVNFNG